ncbi:MAG: putative lipoprotein [Rhodocyclaceae bacterium]|nr:putative lipoprotein [Rhodocyclaceae bacterium]
MPLFPANAADFEGDDAVRKWEEVEVRLPPPPQPAGLVAFYVSAATDNRFFIDLDSVSSGSDGVVRYTLVVVSAAGVRNVSFEGMRCETRERRLYAFGRSDGTWSKSRNNQWERVRESASNRHHAALFQDYFCPDGVIVRNADEARDALRRGGRPSTAGS